MALYGNRGKQVKMRSFGWALTQHDSCPYKKRVLGQRLKEKRPCEDTKRWLSNKPRKGTVEETNPADTLTSDF